MSSERSAVTGGIERTVSIGVDIGGTFTDVFAFDRGSGRAAVTKVPSTPPHFSEGFIAGVREVLHQLGRPPQAIERLAHGTTIATNAIIEHRGARLGLITTRGFRDVLAIGRVRRSEMYDLFMDAEEPLFLIPRRRILEVDERIDSTGKVRNPLSRTSLLEAAQHLVIEDRVEAIVVSFLHSYIQPMHELMAGQILGAEFPEVPVTLASQVSRTVGEYERLVVAAFDAYVRPMVEQHLRTLEGELAGLGVAARLEVMQSNGGLAGATTIRERPIATVESGPAAGMVGALDVAQKAGYLNCVTFDIGGTSADVALIQDGSAGVAPEGRVDRYPLRMSMIDIHSVGAGGGSLASIDSGGGLQVGPRSAGSRPGPAAYGLGGSQPTVTDASVVLGYIPTGAFAADINLNPDLASAAIESNVARPLGMDVVAAALGIHRIANANMANAIRLISIDRGIDPRRLALIAFGGAGPVHAGMVASLLGIETVLIPPAPGVLSAFGLLSAPIQHEAAFSLGAAGGSIMTVSPSQVAEAVAELVALCRPKMELDGVPAERIQLAAYASMRYRGQYHQLEVALSQPVTSDALTIAARLFRQLHEDIYSYDKPNGEVELTGVRVALSGRLDDSTIDLAESLPQTSSEVSATPTNAYFFIDGNPEQLPTKVFHRNQLQFGTPLRGPAIVLQRDTTTVVYPGHEVVRQASGVLIYTAKAEPRSITSRMVATAGDN